MTPITEVTAHTTKDAGLNYIEITRGESFRHYPITTDARRNRVNAALENCTREWNYEPYTNTLERPESVALIPSGYEFICPSCSTYNRVIEITARVTCPACNAQWETEDA